jgi:hypothetical protein
MDAAGGNSCLFVHLLLGFFILSAYFIEKSASKYKFKESKVGF